MKNNKKISRKRKTNKSKNKNNNYLKYCIIGIIIVLLITAIYFFLTAKDDKNSLTILEKQWIMKNKKTLIDINVPNNINIVAEDGRGIVFSLLKRIERDTGLGFNKKAYNYNNSIDSKELSILILENTDKLEEKDILITEDNYVVISKNNENYTNLNNLYNQKIGILSEEEKTISNFLENQNLVTYSNLSDITSDINKGKIKFAIVPRYYALQEIVKNNLYINYSFDDLTNKIVLRTTNNKKLSSIMEKYISLFKEKYYTKSLENEYMDFYHKNTSATDIETTSLSRKIYNYGYVKDSNYNIKDGKKIYGYAGEYINQISEMANIEFNYKEYKTKEKLDEAIKSGEVDIAFIDFDYKNESGSYTIPGFSSKMVALSKDNYLITNKHGLQNRKIYAFKDTYLNAYLNDNYNGIIKNLKNINQNIEDDAILVLDEIDYYYYSNKNKLTDYNLIFKDSYNASYRFFVKNNEEALYNLTNFVLMYEDSNSLKLNSVNNLIAKETNEGGFKNLYILVLVVLILPIVAVCLFALLKNKKSISVLRRQDVLKYSDMLTSLKNRNYLRAHIDEWDEAKIKPRTIIIADLNNLKYVNDNYGQEEGNLLIKKAAAILINTQLEKSEIIRTDGNEFLIYLIGYNKTQVSTYISKLSKEFEKLPHGFGAAIGFSMIEDDIKTIDDAINEASIEMRMDKEQNY